ncbi:MAG: AAA family ATPase [Planctomycetota bacterium]
MTDDPTGPLRDALRVSPDNQPLRRHLADTLAGLGRHDEAEAEYKTLLAASPDDDGVRLALSSSYLAQGKVSHAAVLVELCAGRAGADPAPYVMLARVRFAEQDLRGARAAFREACDRDPSLASSDVAEELGMRAAEPFDGTFDGDADVDVDIDFDEDQPSPAALARGPRGDDDQEGILGDSDFERPKLAFADVGGMGDVKDEISMKVIQPLAHPELFAAYGKKIGGGVLMYGPPGCGKTHLARATAGEAEASFMAVGIHEVLDLWIGSSEKNLHRIFDEARRRAPCVLFFDEVDALGAKRADASNSSARQIINQFLSELDGVEDDNEGLLVLAATNAPWHLDAAFRRPGRFDRLVFVPPPDLEARAAILEVLLRGKPVEGVDAHKVAKRTDKFSGADLKGVVDVAIEAKLRDALKSGAPAPLTEKDLLKAAKKVAPTTTEWFATAKNHVMFANDSGHYDEVARYMGMRGSRGDE